jgi:N-acetylglutamate synthase-like GNAT family acetyltransferase
MPQIPTIRPALPQDRALVVALLAAAALPTGGIEDPLGDSYCVAEYDGDLLGVAGLEVHGRHGLLRSVVVQPRARGTGVARALVADRLAWGRRSNLQGIYLLTTTAATYFQRLGFARVSREAVPAAIRASGEFAELCPQTAVVMTLSLQPDHPPPASG